MAATASCTAKWTVAMSRNGDAPGGRPAALIACIAITFQSDTASAWTFSAKPRYRAALNPVSFLQAVDDHRSLPQFPLSTGKYRAAHGSRNPKQHENIKDS